MSHHRWLLLAILAALLGASGHAQAAPVTEEDGPLAAPSSYAKPIDTEPDVYVVELRQEPLAAYTGGVAGFEATSPSATGEAQLDTSEPAAVAYARYLGVEQSRLERSIARTLGRPIDVMFTYHNVLNGLALTMSPAEARAVRALPEVLAVTKSQRLELHTDSGLRWIGAPGIWDGSAVPGGQGSMGEEVVVGIIDTGINFDHPSFAAVGRDGVPIVNPFGEGNYKGFCDPENENPPPDPVRWPCNSKLVGAWSWPYSGDDPEDDNGHGSHTASTAAGNFVEAGIVAPTIAITLPLQGVAPHANIIAYDISTPDGFSIDAVMAEAVDQAVDDGVDAINMSFGPGATELDPWNAHHLYAQAYLNARRAGVLASISAGNSGPDLGTTASIAPWMPAAAASTHNRVIENVLGNLTGGAGPLADILGRGISNGYGPAPIVHARGYVHADGSADDGLCMEPFPDGTFTGQIVVCERGIIARVDKGANVLAGGAGGMVLANTEATGNSLNADTHFLPAVHITFDDAQRLAEWMGSGTGHMGTISGMHFNYDTDNGDVMAGFSSRGPTLAATCCLRPAPFENWEEGGFLGIRLQNTLKPDFAAPGVDVWAAVSTPDRGDPGPPEYDSYSGTSMASPHIAGAMALMRAVQPSWTAAEIHSALMLTSVTESMRQEDGVTPATPFDIGAGRINVSFAANAGFVLDETAEHMRAEDPSRGGDPTTINLASMANYACVARCTWTRTLTSTRADAVEWTAAPSGDDPLVVSVEPASFVLQPGGTMTITVTAAANAVPYGEYAFGRVDFATDTAGISPAHMPLAVRSVPLALPSSVVSEMPETTLITTSRPVGSSVLGGWESITIGQMAVTANGFTKATEMSAELPGDNQANPFEPGPTTATSLVTVPVGSPRLVAEVTDSDAVDVDLFVGIDANGDGMAQEDELVCVANSGSWTELCDIREPQVGPWWVMVWNASPTGAGVTNTIRYDFGAVADIEASPITVTGPSSTELGVPFDVTVGWELERIQPGDLYYGMFWISDESSEQPFAAVGVDLYGIPPAAPIYLPSVRNHDEPMP